MTDQDPELIFCDDCLSSLVPWMTKVMSRLNPSQERVVLSIRPEGHICEGHQGHALCDHLHAAWFG